MGKNLEERINTIGASYLVSYLYNQYIDSKHNAYKKRKTDKTRETRNLKAHYQEIIKIILTMEESKLANNEIGLTGEDVKGLAKELSEFFLQHGVVSINIKSKDYITLDDLAKCTQFLNETVINLISNQKPINSNDIVIKTVKKGSIIIDLLIGVASGIISNALGGLINNIFRKKEDNKDIRINISNDFNYELKINTEKNDINITIRHKDIK